MVLLPNTSGYLQTRLKVGNKRVTVQIHILVALAFLNHKQGQRKVVVDHIDNDQLNNNLNNLQIITNRENTSKDRKGGSSEYIGVCWVKRDKKWKAQITINYKNVFLGNFNTELEASCAYQNKLKDITKK